MLDPHPFYKRSEFWFALAVAGLGVAKVIFAGNDHALAIIAAILAVVPTVAYVAGRAYVKAGPTSTVGGDAAPSSATSPQAGAPPGAGAGAAR